MKDWLTPSKWVTWRGDAPVPASVGKGSHVISDGSSSAGSAPPAGRMPPSVPTSTHEQRGRKVIEDSSSDPVPPSGLFHERLLAGRNGLISGNPRATPESSTLQRLSQEMEVSGTSPPVGVSAAMSDHKMSGPVTSTPQVSPETLVRERDMNEVGMLEGKNSDEDILQYHFLSDPYYSF